MADKELILTIDDQLHAKLKIALFYDRLGQSQFIKKIIDGYVSNNPHIRNYMDEILQNDLGSVKKRNRKKDRKEFEETNKDFALEEKDIQNIFDILESENEDL